MSLSVPVYRLVLDHQVYPLETLGQGPFGVGFDFAGLPCADNLFIFFGCILRIFRAGWFDPALLELLLVDSNGLEQLVLELVLDEEVFPLEKEVQERVLDVVFLGRLRVLVAHVETEVGNFERVPVHHKRLGQQEDILEEVHHEPQSGSKWLVYYVRLTSDCAQSRGFCQAGSCCLRVSGSTCP